MELAVPDLKDLPANPDNLVTLAALDNLVDPVNQETLEGLDNLVNLAAPDNLVDLVNLVVKVFPDPTPLIVLAQDEVQLCLLQLFMVALNLKAIVAVSKNVYIKNTFFNLSC